MVLYVWLNFSSGLVYDVEAGWASDLKIIIS